MVSFSFLFSANFCGGFGILVRHDKAFGGGLSARVPAPKSPRSGKNLRTTFIYPVPPPAGGEGLFLALGDAATLPADPLQKQAEGAVPSPRLRQHARARRNSSRLALRVVAHHFVIIPQPAAPRV